jgi:plasmid stability protein
MASIFVRNVDSRAVRRLKAMAKAEGRSLQSLMRGMIEQWSGEEKMSPQEARKLSGMFHRRFRGRKFPDVVGMIREDRER